MIESISLKRLKKNGQLDDLNGIDIEICLSKSKEYKRLCLVYNQLENIKILIGMARNNLVFSSGKCVRNICKTLSNDDSKNFQETISSYFLMNSMIHYNSSFDYLKILLRLLYSTYEEIIQNYSKEDIKSEIVYLGIDEKEWQSALGALFLIKKENRFDDWIKKLDSNLKKRHIVFRFYSELKEENKKLKNKYQVNMLKHGYYPIFKKSESNSIFKTCFSISLDNFLNPNSETIAILGTSSSFLFIDEVQNFLIFYNNLLVKALREIYTDFSRQLTTNN